MHGRSQDKIVGCLLFRTFLFVFLLCILSRALACLRITHWAERRAFPTHFCIFLLFVKGTAERKTLFLAAHHKRTEHRAVRPLRSGVRRGTGEMSIQYPYRRTWWTVLRRVVEEFNPRRAEFMVGDDPRNIDDCPRLERKDKKKNKERDQADGDSDGFTFQSLSSHLTYDLTPWP